MLGCFVTFDDTATFSDGSDTNLHFNALQRFSPKEALILLMKRVIYLFSARHYFVLFSSCYNNNICARKALEVLGNPYVSGLNVILFGTGWKEQFLLMSERK